VYDGKVTVGGRDQGHHEPFQSLPLCEHVAHCVVLGARLENQGRTGGSVPSTARLRSPLPALGVIAVARPGQKRDPGLEAAENLANVGSNRRHDRSSVTSRERLDGKPRDDRRARRFWQLGPSAMSAFRSLSGSRRTLSKLRSTPDYEYALQFNGTFGIERFCSDLTSRSRYSCHLTNSPQTGNFHVKESFRASQESIRTFDARRAPPRCTPCPRG
jgi:hypothetical protein